MEMSDQDKTDKGTTLPEPDSPDWTTLQGRIIGLGENSIRKNHYPELKKRLQELERVRALINLSSDLFLVLDLSTLSIVDWNESAKKHLGYDADDEQAPPFSLIDVGPGLKTLQEIRSCSAGKACCMQGKGQISEFRRKNGSSFPVEITISSDDVAKNSYAVIMARDITDRVETERYLRQAAAVFETSLETVRILDTNRTIVSVNPAFMEITGFSADDVIGQPSKILHSDRLSSDYYENIWATVKATGRYQGEIRERRKNGEETPYWGNITAIRDDHGNIYQYLVVMADISKIKETEERVAQLTNYDPLTQLPNRLMLNSVLDHSLKRSLRSQAPLALILLDVDRFKSINDTLGHHAGDKLLKSVAERIIAAAPTAGLIAHTSGDEFGVLLDNIPSPSVAENVANNILQAFSTPVMLDGFEVFVTLSLGISHFPKHGNTCDEISRHSVSAMHQAKANGGNQLQVYTPELTKVAFQNLQIENSLRQAIDAGELELFYQPQFRLSDGKLCGAEALVRWRHPVRGIIPPDVFIPRAEETGLILPMGRQLLIEACTRGKLWLKKGFELMPIAVNISGIQVNNSDIAGTVEEALKITGLPPQYLKLEITESFAMQGAKGSVDKLHKLRNLGVELSIDDFGTGYSSLAYLRDLPVTSLKVDRAFIKNLPDHQGDSAITKAIVAMAQSIGLQVIAEGVETELQRIFLRQIGCDVMQGYLGGRPVPASEFEMTHLAEQKLFNDNGIS